MEINKTTTETLTPQKLTNKPVETTPQKTTPKTTEEVLKSSQQFLLNNKLKPSERAYDVKVESSSSAVDRTIKEKTVAVSALQTADEGMKSTEDILKKMQAIAEKATNTNLTAKEREGLQKQYDGLQKDMAKIAESTNYNGHKLLNGKFELETNSSRDQNKTRNIAIADMSSEGLGISKLSFASPEAAKEATKKLQAASDTVATERKAIKNENATLQKEVDNLSTVNTATKKFNLREIDKETDIGELVKTMKEDIMKQAFEMKNNMHAYNASRVFSLLN